MAMDKGNDRLTTNLSVAKRLGWVITIIILGTWLAIIAASAILSFCWFANKDNRVWRRIVLNGWIPRTVSISTVVIRLSIKIQAGYCAAMLVALLLENVGIPLKDAAKLSTFRTGNANVHSVVFPALQGIRVHRSSSACIYAVLVMTFSCSGMLLEAASTILLSDVRIGSLPGFPSKATLKYGFQYSPDGFLSAGPGGWGSFEVVNYTQVYRSSTWERNPPAYPVFAEYSEPTNPQDNGLDDTGVLLRALLPYSDAASRENLLEYTGMATVLDSRVVCMRPVTQGIRAWVADYTTTMIEGTAGSDMSHSKVLVPEVPPKFTCQIQNYQSQYSICQLQESQLIYGNTSAEDLMAMDGAWKQNSVGGLLSEFTNMTIDDIRPLSSPRILAQTWGSAYLVINSSFSPLVSTYGFPENDSIHDPSFSTQERGTWLDISLFNSTLNTSISLCYTSWDTSDLKVQMLSSKNNSEPLAKFDPQQGKYNLSNIVKQLNNRNEIGAKERNTLKLRKPAEPWTTSIDDQVRPLQIPSFANTFADIFSPFSYTVQAGQALSASISQSPLLLGNKTIFLANSTGISNYNSDLWRSLSEDLNITLSSTNVADITITTLFNEAMSTTGSVAFAMSCLVTTLSHMAYYDQFPQLEKETVVNHIFLVSAVYPQSYGGFIAVVVALLLHLVSLVVTTILYLGHTRYTLLRNYWHTVIQLVGTDTMPVFERGSRLTDKELAAYFEERGSGTVRLGCAKSPPALGEERNGIQS